MENLKTVLKPSSELSDLANEFSRLTKIPMWRSTDYVRIFKYKKFLESIKKFKEKTKEKRLTKFENKFINRTINLLSDSKGRIPIEKAVELSALSMEALTERARMVKKKILRDSENIYEKDIRKVIFILEVNSKVMDKAKNSLTKDISNLSKKEWEDQRDASYIITLLYLYLLGEEDVDLDSLIKNTAQIAKPMVEKRMKEKYDTYS